MKQDKSAKINQRDKFKDSFEIKEFSWTKNQKEIINKALEKNTKIIFIDGVAGTGKSLLSIYCSLMLMKERRVSDLIYIRTIVESSSKGMGALPGEIDMKIKPFLLPLEDKLEELLTKPDIQKLINDNRIHGIPINYLRGASFNAKAILLEEFQNFSLKEGITAITRLGKFSKMFIIGDNFQKDTHNSGFKDLYDLFDGEDSRANGIYCFKLGKEDIMREEVLKFIIEKLESLKPN